MTTPGDTPETPGEFDRLLAAAAEGELSTEEQERLAALLRDDPNLRQKYLDYLLIDSLLRWEQPAETEPAPSEPAPAERSEPARPGPPVSRHTRRKWYLAASVAAMAAGVVLGIAFWPRPDPTPDQQTVQAAEPTDDTVAVLLHSSGAVWGESTVPTRSGSPLPPGRMRLLAGAVRLEFYCGATVILEGPADFNLISRTRASCAGGRLRATIPAHAEGFTIETPALDVVDRGTEVGLRVGAENRTEVHVFKGKVDVYAAGAAGREPPREALTTGQGVRVGVGGAADRILPDPAAFMTSQKLESQLAEETARREREWAAAAEEWCRDPALRAYFSFQAAPPWGRTLTDGAGRLPACDGAIVGSPWVAGRWPGRQGLEFKRVSDRVRLHVPESFDSVTLAAWVRVDSLPNRNNSLLMADGWEEGELHWQIGRDGTAILGVQSMPKGHGAHYHAPGVITPDRFGQWLHLAVTYDGPGRRVRHYLDGQPVSDEPTLFDIPLRIDEAELGNWNLAAHRNNTPIRHLHGCLDEVMLFSRALDGEEVARLYARSRPPL